VILKIGHKRVAKARRIPIRDGDTPELIGFIRDMRKRQGERESRKQELAKFHQEQHKILKWIHLHKIAARCSKTADPTLPPGREKRSAHQCTNCPAGLGSFRRV
jgi:hypothetical protein